MRKLFVQCNVKDADNDWARIDPIIAMHACMHACLYYNDF